MTDTAPVDLWNYDILTPEGEAELRRIVQVITTECAQLPQQGRQATVFTYIQTRFLTFAPQMFFCVVHS